MRQRHHSLFDFGLRLVGIGGAALGVLSIRTLGQLVRVAPAHPAGAIELLTAMAGFLCLTGGAMLAVLGAHITDRIAVSSRWHDAHRRDAAPFQPSDRPVSPTTARPLLMAGH